MPHALLHNLKHNKVLHERVVFLTVVMRDIPYVDPEKRIEVKTLGCDFYQFLAYYGFKEDPDVPALLEESGRRGFAFGQRVPDRKYGQAVVGRHGRDIGIQKMALYMAGQSWCGRARQFPVGNQTHNIIIVFAQPAMVIFDVFEDRTLQRGQVTTVSIPDDLELLKSVACLTSKERLERRKIGRNEGIASDPQIAQGIQMKARPALAR